MIDNARRKSSRKAIASLIYIEKAEHLLPKPAIHEPTSLNRILPIALPSDEEKSPSILICIPENEEGFQDLFVIEEKIALHFLKPKLNKVRKSKIKPSNSNVHHEFLSFQMPRAIATHFRSKS